MRPILAIAFVSACAIAQTGDRKLTDTPREGAGKSDAVNVTGKAEKAGDDRMLLRQSSEGRESVAVLPTGRSIRSNYAKDSMPQKSAPPRLVSIYAPPIALSIMAAADYHTTQRAFRNVPTGREANPVLSCGGQLCGGRFVALNAVMSGAMLAVNRYALPRLSPRGRRALSILEWGAIGFRGYVVVHNYRAGGVR